MSKVHFNNILNKDEQLFGFPMVDLFALTTSFFIWIIICQRVHFLNENVKIFGFVLIFIVSILIYAFKSRKRKGFISDIFLRFYEEILRGAKHKNKENIIEKIEYDNEKIIYVIKTQDFLTGAYEKKLVLGFEVDLFDVEKRSIDSFSDLMTSFFNSLPENVYFRVIFDRFIDTPTDCELNTFRGTHYFKEFNKINSKALIFLEKKITSDGNSSLIHSLFRPKLLKNSGFVDKFIDEVNFNLLDNIGLNYRSISEDQITNFLQFNHAWYSQKRGLIDNGLSYMGVLKLIKLNEHVDKDALLHLLDSTNYDLPFKVVFSTKKVSKSSPRFQLTKSRLSFKRNASLDDQFLGAASEKKMQSSQKLIDQIELDETNLFDFEFHIILEKITEKEIIQTAKKLITDLNYIGEFCLETLRPLKALKSCMPGENHHSPLTFDTDSLFCLTPLYTNGDGVHKLREISNTSIMFHRRNMTESYFEPFFANSYSIAIFGATGTGKSFLMNLLISCMLQDIRRSIFHIDVGSSGIRNAERLKSKIFNISLNEQTGMNPFRVLNYSKLDMSIVNVLCDFTKVLLKEDNEEFISKEISGEIENAILKFCQNFNQLNHSASLKGFYQYCLDNNIRLTRLKILDRWINGIYKQALNDDKKVLEFSKSNYFNFQDIEQAKNSEFVEAVSMACFSLVSLQKIINNKFNQTIVCDEFSFQKTRSLKSFNAIATNYRKVNGSLIIGAQSVDQVSTEHSSELLESILHLFTFNRANEEWKNKLLRLSKADNEKLEEIEKINGFDSRSGIVRKSKLPFREVLYKNAYSDGLIYRLIPSKFEYWNLTSRRDEIEKIENFQKLTGATTEEVLGVIGAFM